MYYRPVISEAGAYCLAGGWARFDAVTVLGRGVAPQTVPAADIPTDALDRLVAPRAPLGGVSLHVPQVMGILNVTPDSFSDGGDFVQVDQAVAHARAMVDAGAAFVDVGGESTRPGAKEVPVAEEIQRVAPVVAALMAQSDVVVSVDTRKAAVAAAVPDGVMINDVSALGFDPDMAKVVARKGAWVCLMHALATPETMADHATYNDVVLDVYDHLSARVDFAVGAGIARDRIVVDPGIGFAKTLDHNLALIRNLSLFHGLGCPVLLGASRKRFIGTLGAAPAAKDRLGGSVAVALEAVRQGVQILRVHDTYETKQAIDLQMAMSGTDTDGT